MAEKGKPLNVLQKELTETVKADGRDVSEFTNRVMVLIQAHRRRSAIRPANAEILQGIESTIASLDKTISAIDAELISGNMYLSDIYGDHGGLWTDHGEKEAILAGTAIMETQRESIIAKRAMQKILSNLERQKEKFPTKKGRPQADENRLIYAVGKLFKKHIGEPSSYEDGVFFDVVRLVLDACGLPSIDPSRSVKSALAALRTRQTSLTKSQE